MRKIDPVPGYPLIASTRVCPVAEAEGLVGDCGDARMIAYADLLLHPDGDCLQIQMPVEGLHHVPTIHTMLVHRCQAVAEALTGVSAVYIME